MNDLPRGMVAPPTLDGVHLTQAPSSTTIRPIDARAVRETATGGRREQRTWWGEAAIENPGRLLPLRRIRHEVEVDYANLFDDRVENVLALSGVHDLAVWKPVTLSYRGDGQTRELWIPWRLAVDVFGLPPGLNAEQVGAAPHVQIGLEGDPFLTATVDAATFDGGPPETGEALFLQGGQLATLGDVPAAGEVVLVRVMPVLRVLDETDAARQYDSRKLFTEPRNLVFREI